MELIEAIYHRRAVRNFTERQPTEDDIQHLLKAAVQAPSALNLQPWSFAVIHGRKRLAGYSERIKAHLEDTLEPEFGPEARADLYAAPSFNIFYNAGTLLVICAKPERLHPAEDCCLAAQNLMLAAHDRGLATCPIGFARSWLNRPEVKAELGIPPTHTAVFPLVIGYPALPPPPAVPRNEPDIVSWKRASS